MDNRSSYRAPEIVSRMWVGLAEDYAIVDRARFERLRAVVDLLDPTDDPLGWLADPRHVAPPEWVRAWAERVYRSLDTLQPGDLDPLP